MKKQINRITLSIPEEIYNKVRVGAKEALRSTSSFVALILKEYFESKPKAK